MKFYIKYYKDTNWQEFTCERIVFNIRYIYLYAKAEDTKKANPMKVFDINLTYQIDIKQ